MKACCNLTGGQQGIHDILEVDSSIFLDSGSGDGQLLILDGKSQLDRGICGTDELASLLADPAVGENSIRRELAPVEQRIEGVRSGGKSTTKCGAHEISGQDRFPYANHGKPEPRIELEYADSLKEEWRPQIQHPSDSGCGGVISDQLSSSSSGVALDLSATIKHEISAGLTPAIRCAEAILSGFRRIRLSLASERNPGICS